MRTNTLLLPRLLAALALFLFSGMSSAKDCTADIQPATTQDPKVAVEELRYLVRPLTVCELNAEAEGWLSLLKSKVAQISENEVRALRIRKEDRQTDRSAATGDGVVSPGATVPAGAAPGDGGAEDKSALRRQINELIAERTALIDRFEIVLLQLTAKGGDAAEYNNYIKAVSGVKVDVTDASATWNTITGWLASPEGGLRWAVNIVQFAFIVLVFFILSALAGKAMQRAFSRSTRFSSLLRDFLVVATRRLVLFIGFFVGLSALEVNVGPVLAVVGAAGFVIAFALQSSLSNFASGILMLLYRPFDIGDFVNVAGVAGKVESMNLLSTQLRTPDNQLMVVPNNSVWGDVITNITGITQRRVDLTFGIGYGDDIDRAQSILEDIIAAHDKVLAEPKPVVKLHALADSSVNFICRPWVTPENYWDVYWDITREVKRRFDAEGVSIPFPQRDVHIYQQAVD